MKYFYSKEWLNASKFASGQGVGFYNARFFERINGLNEDIKCEEEKIIFISQKSDLHFVQNEIKQIYSIINTKECELIFRLHPRQTISEFEPLKNELPELKIMKHSDNLKFGYKTIFFCGNSSSIFQLLDMGKEKLGKK